jgi:hypothetical protein
MNPAPTKRLNIVFGAIALLIALVPISILCVLGVIYLKNLRTDPNTESGKDKCEATFYHIAPLISAVEIYKQWKGAYPTSEEELGLRTPPPFAYYMSDPPGYSINSKLGWDPSITYYKKGDGTESLIYDPGDGSPTTNLNHILNRNKKPNQSQTTTMAVTPAASQPSRQP